jgi:hypothetical protein
MILSDHRLPSRPIFYPAYQRVWQILRGDHTESLLCVDLNGRQRTPMILSDHRLPSRPFRCFMKSRIFPSPYEWMCIARSVVVAH